MRRNISNVHCCVIGAPLFGSTLAPRRSIPFQNSAGTWSRVPGKQFGVLVRWRDCHTRPARWSDTLQIRPVRWRKWNRIRIDLARLADPVDATWQHRPGSALAQIMACCLMSPSHYLNQRWLNVKGVGGIQLTAISSDMLMHLIGVKCLRRLHFKITAISPKLRWVNKLHWYLIGSTYISTRKMHLIKFSVK